MKQKATEGLNAVITATGKFISGNPETGEIVSVTATTVRFTFLFCLIIVTYRTVAI